MKPAYRIMNMFKNNMYSFNTITSDNVQTRGMGLIIYVNGYFQANTNWVDPFNFKEIFYLYIHHCYIEQFPITNSTRFN